jgi:hypothetical protein
VSFTKIGYGKSQCAVYDWLKEHPNSSSHEVGNAFGKSTKWAYRILASLEDAFRIAANTNFPIRWWIIERKEETT